MRRVHIPIAIGSVMLILMQVGHSQSTADYRGAVRHASQEYRGDVPSPNSALSAVRDEDLRATKTAKISAFREFFAGGRAITEQQVVERFGHPDRHGVLYLSQKEEPPSWWYYQLDAHECIGVAVEDQKVGMVVYFRSDHTGETIRPK